MQHLPSVLLEIVKIPGMATGKGLRVLEDPRLISELLWEDYF